MPISVPIRVKKGSAQHRKLTDFFSRFPVMCMCDGPRIIVVDVEKMTTLEYCMAEVQKDGCVLEFVPEEFKTPELCLTAVQNNRGALKFVPQHLKTSEFLAMLEAPIA